MQLNEIISLVDKSKNTVGIIPANDIQTKKLTVVIYQTLSDVVDELKKHAEHFNEMHIKLEAYEGGTPVMEQPEEEETHENPDSE